MFPLSNDATLHRQDKYVSYRTTFILLPLRVVFPHRVTGVDCLRSLMESLCTYLAG